ncbi:MAG: hypothetical protein IJ400_07185 [Clostridia bacterium]|nr:hypothetical protein [Clostridia bacterium]
MKNSLKQKEILNLKLKHNILKEVPCTDEESKEYAQMLKDGLPLPDDVHEPEFEGYAFFKTDGADLTEQETSQLLALRKLDYLKTIRNCVLFFTTCAIISMVVAFIIAISH